MLLSKRSVQSLYIVLSKQLFTEYYATSRAPMDCSEKHNKPSIVFPVLAEHCQFANMHATNGYLYFASIMPVASS